jgi:hypothetical protein
VSSHEFSCQLHLTSLARHFPDRVIPFYGGRLVHSVQRYFYVGGASASDLSLHRYEQRLAFLRLRLPFLSQPRGSLNNIQRALSKYLSAIGESAVLLQSREPTRSLPISIRYYNSALEFSLLFFSSSSLFSLLLISRTLDEQRAFDHRATKTINNRNAYSRRNSRDVQAPLLRTSIMSISDLSLCHV